MKTKFIECDDQKLQCVGSCSPKSLTNERFIIGTYYPNSHDKLILGRFTPSHTVSLLGRVPPSWSRSFYPNLLEKVDQGITPYWVVFPQVEVEHVHSSRMMKTKFIAAMVRNWNVLGRVPPNHWQMKGLLLGRTTPIHMISWYWDVLPQVTQSNYWVVFPQVDQNHSTPTYWKVDQGIIDKWKYYYWDALPQFTW